MKGKLVPTTPIIEAKRIEPDDDRPAVGSWWWVKGADSAEEAENNYNEREEHFLDNLKKYDKGKQWLGCVVEVGSNYAILEGVRWRERIAVDDLPKRCSVATEPQAFIDAKVNEHRTKVRELMGEIQRVCHQLGVPMHQALAQAEAPSTALAVAHGVEDVNAYGKALAKAKDKTLPELFKKVKEQHVHMATWMKAELIPASAELERAKGVTEIINNKIHTVELYAGLQEKLVQIRKGEPASVDAKVHLMQRRAYMDEECLVRYQAGGMDFEDLEAFDKWLARDEHMTRILPHERCILAFRVRRYNKDYGVGDSLERFIKFQFHNEYNKQTFLYIRNGRQLWRMNTKVEFGDELFSHAESHDLIGSDELWVQHNNDDDAKFISGRTYAGMIASWKEDRAECAAKLWAWKRAGKPDEKTLWTYDPEGKIPFWTGACSGHPWPDTDPKWPKEIPRSVRECGRPDGSESLTGAAWRSYQRITPTHTFFDDAMKYIAEITIEHNRVAVIVQGLLDRSTCLHPHPPWRIWTPEGFAAGIELTYDQSLAITPGEAPDWKGYREQLNKSIRPGAFVIGQYPAWRAEMEEKFSTRRRDSWWEITKAVGNGPRRIDQVLAVRAGKVRFAWNRKSQRGERYTVPAETPGYIYHRTRYAELTQTWWCPIEEITCIDAYTPGDFHIFFDDPRTRANYIQWAHILLAAEDWHAKRVTEPDYNGDDDE